MTHAVDILFCPVVSLGHLPPQERDPIVRLFTQYLRGATENDQHRLDRLGRDIRNAEAGEYFAIKREEERSPSFHGRHRAILQRVFNGQEFAPSYAGVDAFHDWVKLKAGFWDWGRGGLRPASTSFDNCPEDRLREFHARMLQMLRDPDIEQQLFPSLPAPSRAAFVDELLREDVAPGAERGR